MEDHSNQVAEKTEEQSGSVLLTYFEGDISSMVDEHFTRALSQAKNPKGERFKNKRNRKSAQTIESKQWKTQSETEFQTMFSSERLQHGASSNPHMSLSHAPNGTHIWPGSTRQNINLPLPPMVYPSAVSPGVVMVAEHQYTNSFLYNDHSDLGSAVMNPTKQDLISGWPKHPGFGSQMSSDFGLDSGVQMIENKNLYWY